VRVLLDECVPRPLKRELAGFDVVHVTELGWAGRRNGILLASMREAGFDTLVTVDRNLQFQQNIPAAGMIVVVLYARTNRIPDLRPLMPAVRDILATAKAGTVYRAGA
jgi:hypothetical protein